MAYVCPMKKDILNVNKVDIPAINYSNIKEDLECDASNYYRIGSFLGVKMLLKAMNDPAGLISSIKLYVIDSLTSKNPVTF